MGYTLRTGTCDLGVGEGELSYPKIRRLFSREQQTINDLYHSRADFSRPLVACSVLEDCGRSHGSSLH